MELTECAPWKEHLFNLEDEQKIEPVIKYVIYPSGETYRIQAVPITMDSFNLRYFLIIYLVISDQKLEKFPLNPFNFEVPQKL